MSFAPMLRSFLLLLALALPAFAQTAPAQPLPPPPTLADLLAEKFFVQTLDGKTVELRKLLVPGKPVVLDFWATWCGPCREEIPHLNHIAEQYGKDGLIVIGLNLESPTDDREAVKDFVKEFQMKYPSVFAPSRIYKFFNPNATSYRIPQTIVFDAKGQLLRRLVGYSSTKGKDVLEEAVTRAMKTPR